METETSQDTPSRRRRFGKILFIFGIILEVMLIVLGGLVGVVSASTGNQYIMSEYSRFVIYPIALGGSFILFGLAAWLSPEGLSDDTLWIVKLGPTGGRN
ncbi:MAG: hypothetical protein RTU92_10070 [Candidatus Thorarchaeota archaeon]